MSNCELCLSSHPREIWRNRNFYVVDASEDDLPGFVRIVAVEHVKEISDLPVSVRNELFEILTLVESVMIETMTPDKVNLASLGNMVPHVHWHVIARYQDDAFFPGSIWSTRVRESQEGVLSARRKQAKHMLEVLKNNLSETFA